MPLHLIHGPPNSGRAGLVRQRVSASLRAEPALVVPTADDVYSFERELCEERAVLGASVMTFGGLFAHRRRGRRQPAGGRAAHPRAAAWRRRGGDRGGARVASGRCGAPPGGPGSPVALERLLDELQGAGLEPDDVEAAAATLESSAYLADVAALFAAYASVRDGLGRVDSHGVAVEAIAPAARAGAFWRERPVFLYGFDDLTRNQLRLIAALSAVDRGDGGALLRGRQRGPGGAHRPAGEPAGARGRRGDRDRAEPREHRLGPALPPRAELRGRAPGQAPRRRGPGDPAQRRPARTKPRRSAPRSRS